MKGDDDPITFILACIGISAGIFLTFIGVKVLKQIIVGYFRSLAGKDDE